MADLLTSPAEVAPVTPNEPGAQTSQTEAPQQTPEQGTQTPTKVNLQEFPEFREYQRQIGRTMTDLQQRAQALEQQQREAAMAQMTPEQRTQYQLQWQAQQIQNYQLELQRREQDVQRQKDIAELSRRSGAPASVFEAAETFEEATMLALEYARQHSPQALAQQAERQEANRVDLGTGTAVTAGDRKLQEARAALAQGDSRAYFRMLLED